MRKENFAIEANSNIISDIGIAPSLPIYSSLEDDILVCSAYYSVGNCDQQHPFDSSDLLRAVGITFC